MMGFREARPIVSMGCGGRGGPRYLPAGPPDRLARRRLGRIAHGGCVADWGAALVGSSLPAFGTRAWERARLRLRGEICDLRISARPRNPARRSPARPHRYSAPGARARSRNIATDG